MSWGEISKDKNGKLFIQGEKESFPIENMELPEEFSVFSLHPVDGTFITPDLPEEWRKHAKYFAINIDAYKEHLIKHIKCKNNVLFSYLKFFGKKYKIILPYPVKHTEIMKRIFEKFSYKEINFYIKGNPEILYINFKTAFPFVYNGLFKFLNFFDKDDLQFLLKNFGKLKIALFNIFCSLRDKSFFESLQELESENKTLLKFFHENHDIINMIEKEIYSEFLDSSLILVRIELKVDWCEGKILIEELLTEESFNFFEKHYEKSKIEFTVSKNETVKFTLADANMSLINSSEHYFKDLLEFTSLKKLSVNSFIFNKIAEVEKDLPTSIQEIINIVQVF